MSRVRSCLSAAVLALTSLSTPVFAADPVYGLNESGPCADQRVFKNIVKRFDYQVEHVPHLADVAIMDFQNVHQHRYIPQSEDRPIARRFCGATVALSDGNHREIWYLIEERMSYATLIDGFRQADEVRGSNVEFCVAGFDRWMVYNGACRVLR